MTIATYVNLESVAILGSERAIPTSELVDVGVGLCMTVEHRLIETPVRALVAFVGLGANVTAAQVILQVMLQVRYERAPWTLQHLFSRDVLPHVHPQFLLDFCAEVAMTAGNFTFRPLLVGEIAIGSCRVAAAVKHLDVTTQTTLGPRRVVAVRTPVIEVQAHVSVEVKLLVPDIWTDMTGKLLHARGFACILQSTGTGSSCAVSGW